VADGDGDGGQLRIAHSGGACVFREGGQCEIHREAGEMALPVSCRHFPRVILRDPRGMLIALSHYCPTAAALLFERHESVRVLAPGECLTVREPIEGLDAREVLPPLVHPRMLADLPGYGAWERSVIDTLCAAQHSGRALDIIEAATEDVRRWTPGSSSLVAAVLAAFGEVAPQPFSRGRRSVELEVVRAMYRGDVPLEPPTDFEKAWERALPPERGDLHRPVALYLAARAFGNWVAYQGHGLRSIVAWLRACHDVLRVTALSGRATPAGPLSTRELLEAIRVADLVMLHSINSHAFARAAVAFEKEPAA
jgi:hypothetical protein